MNYKSIFSRIGARLWNTIPRNLRELPKKYFKASIENELLNMLDKRMYFLRYTTLFINWNLWSTSNQCLLSIFAPDFKLVFLTCRNININHIFHLKLAVVNTWRFRYSNCGEWYEDTFDHRCYVHNLSSCEIKYWKKICRLEWDSNPWLLRYRCSALPAELSREASVA